MGYHPQAEHGAIWPGIWNPDWDKRFEELYGYDPAKAKALLAQAGIRRALSSPCISTPCRGSQR